MSPQKEIRDFMKQLKILQQTTLEENDIDSLNIIQLLHLIEASKEMIRTSEIIISEIKVQ